MDVNNTDVRLHPQETASAQNFFFSLGDSYTIYRAVNSLLLPDDYAYTFAEKTPP